MSEHPEKIWAGPCETSDGFISGKYCNGYEGMSYAREYIRADLAAERIAELKAERLELKAKIKQLESDLSGAMAAADSLYCDTLSLLQGQENDDE